MSSTKSDIQILLCENYDTLCDTAAQTLSSLAEKAIDERGQFAMSLSGSYTPKGLYLLMASAGYQELFDWHKMHFFWGDERWVPPDDPKSNYRMVAEALLTKIDIPMENIHPVKTREKNCQTSAALYEKELISFFGLKQGEIPRLDVALLGLGQDGHVASLFPRDPAIEETKRLVIGVSPEQTVEERVTVTLPVINEARCVIFLISGTEKARALYNVMEGEGEVVPAMKVSPRKGSLLWIADKQAASLLKIKK